MTTIDPADLYERDPKPFGTPVTRIATAARVTFVSPRPKTKGPPGFETVMTVGVETQFGVLELSIDERSAKFLIGVLPEYLPGDASE
jgi:hypothetical protein